MKRPTEILVATPLGCSAGAAVTARVAALVFALSIPAAAGSLELANNGSTGGPGTFVADEIRREGEAHGMTLSDDPSATRIALTVEIAGGAVAQRYSIRVRNDGGRRTIMVRGADATGAMYGGLDIAETIRIGTLGSVKASDHMPHIAQRGIKFNIPLDLRTPSYTDCSDAAQAVRVPELPEVAPDDVWRTRASLEGTFSFAGNDTVRSGMLADHEVVKRMTLDEKIEFWRRSRHRPPLEARHPQG